MSFFQPLYSDEINKKLLFQLQKNTQKSLIATIILSVIIVYLLYPIIDAVYLYGWFFLFTFITFLRLYKSFQYLSHNCKDADSKCYDQFAAMTVISGLLWGVVPLLFLPQVADHVTFFFISIILLGVTGGATGSLTADKRIAMSFILAIVIPFGYTLFMYIDGAMSFMSILLILLYVMTLFNVTENTSDTIIKSYQKEEEILKTKQLLKFEQERLSNLFQQTPVGTFYFDMNLHIIDCNNSFAELLHNTVEVLVGLDMNKIPDQRPVETFKKVLQTGKTEVYHGAYHSLTGLDLWIESKCSPLFNNEGELIGGIVLIENKTIEKKALDDLNYMAIHDKLSGLLNRRGFERAMSELIASEKHKEYYSLLFYFDINQFKGINDSLGHKFGDEVLVTVANRLQFLFDENIIMSRYGGDEFIITIPNVTKLKDQMQEKTEEYLTFINSIFDDPFIIDGLHLYIRSSIGIVEIEPNSQNIEEMIRHADLTMYQAKNSYNNISYYDSKFDEQQQMLFGLQHDLAFASENDQLKLMFQPIVDLNNNDLVAAEALLRWNHPDNGLLSPDAFIPLAMKGGLLHKITWWVTDTVCRQIKVWKEEGLWNLQYISINVNAQQLVEQNFATTFLNILDYYDVKTNEIIIEITEESLIDNFEGAQKVIDQLRKSGVRCAIDDFGIGYSSLSYLQKLSFHMLKIDKEFIREIEYDPKILKLIKSILEIGRIFDYHIVIEGIEYQKQREILLSLESNMNYQGYFFSKPIDVGKFQKTFLLT